MPVPPFPCRPGLETGMFLSICTGESERMRQKKKLPPRKQQEKHERKDTISQLPTIRTGAMTSGVSWIKRYPRGTTMGWERNKTSERLEQKHQIAMRVKNPRSPRRLSLALSHAYPFLPVCAVLIFPRAGRAIRERKEREEGKEKKKLPLVRIAFYIIPCLPS